MADCKHELKDLVGMADGIHCMKCGAVLNEMPKKENPETRKEGKKNARK